VVDSLKGCLFLPFPESSGQIVITQTPASVTALPGDTVTIQCKASSSVSYEMQLYLFKSGQTPKLLIYDGNSRFTGVPDRFSGRYSGTDFTFSINGVQVEDFGEYYCGQDNSSPLTVIQVFVGSYFSVTVLVQPGVLKAIAEMHKPIPVLHTRVPLKKKKNWCIFQKHLKQFLLRMPSCNIFPTQEQSCAANIFHTILSLTYLGHSH
uniref:Ig-like domain-containing protein n=1 Tax=Pelusios castaneus TaxID=367368 RepID=A0A8C8S445_9SAUR